MAVDQHNPDARNKGPSLWRFLPLALVLLAVGAVFATGLHRSFTFEAFLHYQARLQELVAARRVTMLGAYMLVYVTAVTLSLPASAFLSAIGGYLFGWAVGGAAASASATVGATCIFLIARTSVGEPLLRRAGARIQGLAAGFQRRAFSYLLFLRLMPVMPFWLTNLAAAFFGMRLRTYVLATLAGMVPMSFAFAFAGSGLDEVVAEHRRAHDDCVAAGRPDCSMDFDASTLLTPQLMIALGVLGTMALAPLLVRSWRSRHKGAA